LTAEHAEFAESVFAEVPKNFGEFCALGG